MKSITSITLVAIIAMLATPQSQAGDKTGALIGGIIGGLIIGEVLDNDRVHTHVSVSRHGGYGRYDWVTVKTWVPGYYERYCDRYGRSHRVWVRGHFRYEKQKVWVEDRRPHYRHPGHGRSYDRCDNGCRDGCRHDRRSRHSRY